MTKHPHEHPVRHLVRNVALTGAVLVGGAGAVAGSGATLAGQAIVNQFASHPPTIDPLEEESYLLAFERSPASVQQQIQANITQIKNSAILTKTPPLSPVATIQAAVYLLPAPEQQAFNNEVQTAYAGLANAQKSDTSATTTAQSLSGSNPGTAVTGAAAVAVTQDNTRSI